MSTSMLVDDDDLRRITGRRSKSHQIAWLRQSGIPFFVNATGHPVVTRAAVEGRQEAEKPQRWQPRVIAGAA